MNKRSASSCKIAQCRRLALLLAVLTLCACGPKSTVTRPVAGASGPAQADDIQIEIEIESEISDQRDKFEQGTSALAERNFDKARGIFNEIIADNPTLSGPHANLALIDFKQSRYQQAFDRVNRAIELNPSNSQAFHLRAQIYLQQGEIKKARDDYLRALELNPGYLNAHYNLALLYDIYLQEIALAIDHYTTYLSLLGEKDETIEEWVNHLEGTLENG